MPSRTSRSGSKLYETGYRFGSDERARIYLTNALEPAHDFSGRLEFAIPALAHEAQAVSEIKKKRRFTVVVGNPPYASVSSNMTPWIHRETNVYLEIDGVRIQEKSKRNHLQNDYIKFIRLADLRCQFSQLSLFGYVTSNSYLDGRTLRGLRWHLLQRFQNIRILNLFGDSKKRDAAPDDENIFDITEGVSVVLACRGDTRGSEAVCYGELQGSREHKYRELLKFPAEIPFSDISVAAPHYLFKKVDALVREEFLALGPSLEQIYRVSGAGLKTNRDEFATDENRNSLLNRMMEFADRTISDEEIRSRYSLKDNYVWKLPKARADFMSRPVTEKKIVPLLYRPFDARYVYFDKAVVFNPRFQVMNHMVDGDNLAIVSIGQNESTVFNHAFVSRALVEIKMATHYGASVVFPTGLSARTAGSLGLGESGESNLTIVASHLVQLLGSPNSTGESPEMRVAHYIYAVLYSEIYRDKYAGPLMMEFPRVPINLSPVLFRELARLGGEVVAQHLMESPKLGNFITIYTGPRNPEVGRVGWSDDTVWLNAAATKKGGPATPGTIGFRGVPEEVWNFHIGGYQVCEKWLKDRKGRTLSKDDIAHYQKIVVAIAETIRLMKEIDAVIERHGGWPGAFQTDEGRTATPKIILFRPRIVQPRLKERYVTCVPLVPLKAAAGAFGDPQHVQDDDWEWTAVETKHRLRPGMFVAQVVGKSMEPVIPDGSYCLFAAPVIGTRQGKTLLVQLRDTTDSESGERYTVKRYESEKTEDGDSWHHAAITLKPLNPDFEPIVLIGADDGQFQVVAELVEVLAEH